MIWMALELRFLLLASMSVKGGGKVDHVAVSTA